MKTNDGHILPVVVFALYTHARSSVDYCLGVQEIGVHDVKLLVKYNIDLSQWIYFERSTPSRNVPCATTICYPTRLRSATVPCRLSIGQMK